MHSNRISSFTHAQYGRHADLLESALDPHLLLDLALQLVLLSSTFVERVPRIVDVEPIVVLTRRKLYKL